MTDQPQNNAPWQSQKKSAPWQSQGGEQNAHPNPTQDAGLGQQWGHGQNQNNQPWQGQQHSGQQSRPAGAGQQWANEPQRQTGQSLQPYPQGASPTAYPQGASPTAYPQGASPTAYPQGGHAPLGKIRNTWGCIGLFVITFGIYGLFWTYSVFEEMKRHRGAGTGGGIALLIEIVFAPATYFMAPSEVAALYTSNRRPAPVSGATGLWILLPVFGPLIWFFQVNGALNDYWASLGAGQQHPALSA